MSRLSAAEREFFVALKRGDCQGIARRSAARCGPLCKALVFDISKYEEAKAALGKR